MTLTYLLIVIGDIVWCVSVISLMMIVYVSLKIDRINSTLVSVTVLVVVWLIMKSYSESLRTSGWYRELVHFLYYGSFMMWYAGALYIICYVIKKYQYGYSFASKSIIIGFFASFTIQFLQYSEQLLFDKLYFYPIYRIAIPTINISIALTVLSFSSVVFYQVISCRNDKVKTWFF